MYHYKQSSIASDSSSSSSMPQKKYAVHVNLANTSAGKYTPKKTRRTGLQFCYIFSAVYKYDLCYSVINLHSVTSTVLYRKAFVFDVINYIINYYIRPFAVSTSESVVGDKELSTIKKALERATKQITDSETLLRCNTPIGPEAIELPVKHYVYIHDI